MTTSALTPEEEEIVVRLVELFDEEKRENLKQVLKTLQGNLLTYKPLADEIHSVKWRIKDPDHLRDKLIRKMQRAKEEGVEFDIDKENFFEKITDLGGLRVLHTHTRQMKEIHKALLEIFDEHKYKLAEAPFARTWDTESAEYFKALGIETQNSFPNLYTSVHYVIESNRRTMYTAEIQVRTLAEEVWGEVDHLINYPVPTDSVACSEQLKVLARVALTCSRLVDSIMRSLEDHVSKTN